MHFSGSRTKAIACESKDLWKSASLEKQWISKIVQVNFSKTLEIYKRFATTQGQEPHLGKNRQDGGILICSFWSLPLSSFTVALKTTVPQSKWKLAATGGSRQALTSPNHHSRELLLFDLSCSSLDTVIKQVFMGLDSELTLSVQPFPQGYLSKTISSNCLILHLPEVAITVGTDNKLKRNLKGKAKFVKISEKNISISPDDHAHVQVSVHAQCHVQGQKNAENQEITSTFFMVSHLLTIQVMGFLLWKCAGPYNLLSRTVLLLRDQTDKWPDNRWK